MFVVASAPLRVSLFGGSTDSPDFVQKFGVGEVISFSSNLRTYVTISQDSMFGYNSDAKHYIINYTRREEVSTVQEIQNELVRTVLEYFDMPRVCVTLTSDVYAQGSGLASSSSYIISMIKAIAIFKGIQISDSEICGLAHRLELKFNQFCGYQDPYGCGIGGFKKMTFKTDSIQYELLPEKIFDLYDMRLIFTGVTRDSKPVLQDVARNVDKALPLLDITQQAYRALKDEDFALFFALLNDGWDQKKQTSQFITENEAIREIDGTLASCPDVLAHKLCGAGNGGFFLAISEKNSLQIPYKSIPISVANGAIRGEQHGLF